MGSATAGGWAAAGLGDGGLAYVKMLVMELFKNHPLFAGRPFSQWSKKLMNRDALAHSTGKTHVFHFCLEHTHRPPAPPADLQALWLR